MSRFSGVASALSVVADRIRQQREQKEGLGLLGETEKIKAQYSPKEWKPQTEEEALKFEEAKKIPKSYSDVFEENIKGKIASGETLNNIEKDYYNKFMISAFYREPVKIEQKTTQEPLFKSESGVVSYMKGLGEAFKERPLGALTPSFMKKEKKLQVKTNTIPIDNSRQQAINALNSAGYPITEANIKSAIEQLRGQ